MPRGTKWWRFRYRFQHREEMISLGIYPRVNLTTARLQRADANTAPIDPGFRPAAARRSSELCASVTKVRFQGGHAAWISGYRVHAAQ